MATTKSRRLEFWRRAAMAAFALLGLAASSGSARAQSTDRDNPTPLASNEIRGNAIGKKVEYYYTFLAGPGEVVITVDSGAKGSFSQLEVELFDMDAQQLALLQNLPYPGETSRKVKRVSFGAQQPVLLRIFLDREAAQYLVRVGGAVQVAGADTSFSGSAGAMNTTSGANPTAASSTLSSGGGDASTPAGTSSSASQPAQSQPVSPAQTDATSTSGSGAAAEPPATSLSGSDATPTGTPAGPVARASVLKRLWLKLSSAGEMLGMAGAGSLHVELKDGTVQEIGIGRIRHVMVGESTRASSDASSVTPSGEDKLSGWQRLWLKVGPVGEVFGLNNRPVRLEMKDGTIQEFSPSKVKKISIRK
jgi:hypothetical protein